MITSWCRFGTLEKLQPHLGDIYEPCTWDVAYTLLLEVIEYRFGLAPTLLIFSWYQKFKFQMKAFMIWDHNGIDTNEMNKEALVFFHLVIIHDQ